MTNPTMVAVIPRRSTMLTPKMNMKTGSTALVVVMKFGSTTDPYR
jgi:hypothetical protein